MLCVSGMRNVSEHTDCPDCTYTLAKYNIVITIADTDNFIPTRFSDQLGLGSQKGGEIISTFSNELLMSTARQKLKLYKAKADFREVAVA